MCPICESPEPVNREIPMFTVPRRTNDCGVMAVNAIISYFPISAMSPMRRSFVTHLDMNPLVRQTGERPRVGMTYDYQHIQLALSTRDYTCIPVFTDNGSGQPMVQLHRNVLAVLVVVHGHMYCYIKQNNNWMLFDSTYGTLQTPTYSTVQLTSLLYNTNTMHNTIVGVINTLLCFRTHAACTETASMQCTSGAHLLCDTCSTSNDRHSRGRNDQSAPVCYCTTTFLDM